MSERNQRLLVKRYLGTDIGPLLLDEAVDLVRDAFVMRDMVVNDQAEAFGRVLKGYRTQR